ncbi:putative SWI/SNF-related matrix-associated actin-dependent regulator of chromatin subfamily A member 3-like 1 [Vigna radiata var. radiata]|uniref:SWI/SNF-related matrix-associated actin-dependent regulator of chromatin subfamily A member 3-like 1 n=1 Tax=Vigna radiata var. radiata TaxID=3916 RepID=A0A1S3TBJ1_VIGRR|nr:putative SWI/SNF-related matrix-associated actin-dependent regulator of chromatin subfamily A member 3-like 1 [Vigna radiata var. radiata]
MDSGDDKTASASSSSELFLLGFIEANIVGVQHHHATISGRAVVVLHREPDNIHDANAIKVTNIHGDHVGYIERAVAAVLTPLIDNELITVAAIVPDARKTYRILCQIHIFARLQDFEVVKCALSRCPCRLINESEAAFTLSDSAAVKATKAVKNTMTVDAIFSLMNSNLANKNRAIDFLEPPRSIIRTELLPHQKEGLAWLVRREKTDDLPPFWEENDGKFVNILTDYQTDKRPDPLRGGIVADEMGLGKTLTLLSLIAFDKMSLMGVSMKCRTDGMWVSLEKRRRNEIEGYRGTGLRTNATLVVCPPSAMSAWITQLEDHSVPGALKTYLYYGERRTEDTEELKKYDLVLTTYTTLSNELDQMPAKQMEWRRIILDEAHTIKNFTANQSKTVFGLKGQYRWAVTGTPIQSGCIDLYSFMVFLRFQPFSERRYWKNLVQTPLNLGMENGFTRLQILMGAIALRRTKDLALTCLPPKTIEICYVELSMEERQLYEREKEKIKALLRRKHTRESNTLAEYSEVLNSFLILRQICADLKLCKFQSDSSSITDSEGERIISYNPELLQKLLGQLEEGEDIECPICLSPPMEIVITRCAHIFCRPCILRSLEERKKNGCPLCRQKLSPESDIFSPPPQPETDTAELSSASEKPLSSKVSTLIKCLDESRDQNPGVKSVVFSQFRKLLCLLEEPLNAAGFKTLRLDGKMNAKQRANVVEQFQAGGSDSCPTVLLASLRASSSGVNLTAASRLYFMEPWWNHAVEEQAMDRVHRIGQNKPVKIVRFIAQNSFEEKMLVLQERRKRLSKEPYATQSKGIDYRDMQFLLDS